MAVSGLFELSYIALWILNIVLFAAVFILYRHFGDMLAQREEQVERGGPEVGKSLRVELTTVNKTVYRLGTGESARPQIVFFASPNCRHCESAGPVIKKLAAAHINVNIVVVYSGDIESTKGYASSISSESVAVSDPGKELMKAWNVPGTPFMVVLDPVGIVQKKGVASAQSALKNYFQIANRFATFEA